MQQFLLLNRKESEFELRTGKIMSEYVTLTALVIDTKLKDLIRS